MKISAFQFKISSSIDENYIKIKKAVIKSASEKVRLVVTQECALTGYPPIEIGSIDDIDFIKVNDSIAKLTNLSKELGIYIALGSIKQIEDKYLNSIIMISPNGDIDSYDKRALWGYDQNNFIPGENSTMYWEIDNIKIGIRICFEIRFPEYFRELYKQNVDIVIVSFCDISDKPNKGRLEIIKSHLLTRAIENAYTVISVNGISKFQTAPTCIINPDGYILKEAPMNEEFILIYDYIKSDSNLGRDGRIFYNNSLL